MCMCQCVSVGQCVCVCKVRKAHSERQGRADQACVRACVSCLRCPWYASTLRYARRIVVTARHCTPNARDSLARAEKNGVRAGGQAERRGGIEEGKEGRTNWRRRGARRGERRELGGQVGSAGRPCRQRRRRQTGERRKSEVLPGWNLNGGYRARAWRGHGRVSGLARRMA